MFNHKIHARATRQRNSLHLPAVRTGKSLRDPFANMDAQFFIIFLESMIF